MLPRESMKQLPPVAALPVVLLVAAAAFGS
jgi:hypothetical protein